MLNPAEFAALRLQVPAGVSVQMSSSKAMSNGDAVGDVLSRLDTDLASLAGGVAGARYAFWVGSGISRDAVPNLPSLIRRALEHLQSQVVPGDATCRFRSALDDMLLRGGLVEAEREEINLDQPPETWPNIAVIVQRLVGQYSSVLETPVANEHSDYLLWEAVDVRGAYADRDLTPDAEHYCLAVLLLEGLVSEIVSANWDGLIERAVFALAESPDAALRVCVRPDDYRAPEARADLIKFHGCAVRASEDEDEYRKLLVGMQAQIAELAEDAQHARAVAGLVTLITSKPTLMVGLSAQDADVQAIFAKAKALMPWHWPADPPAIAFAEEAIGPRQQTILRIVYGEDYEPNDAEINATAGLRCFAKPLLSGLVLHCITTKLDHLAGARAAAYSQPDLARLRDGLTWLRDTAAAAADHGWLDLAMGAIDQVRLVLSLFRSGTAPSPGSHLYDPITTEPAHLALSNPSVRDSGLGYLAIGFALLGIGGSSGHWTLTAGDKSAATAGAVRLTSTAGSSTRMFFVEDSAVLAKMEESGLLDLRHADVLVLSSSALEPRATRSPRQRYGRTIHTKGRSISISQLVSECSDLEQLLQRFREEVAA